MGKPIEDGAGQSFVIEDLGPLFERANTMHLKMAPFQLQHRSLRLRSLHCSN